MLREGGCPPRRFEATYIEDDFKEDLRNMSADYEVGTNERFGDQLMVLPTWDVICLQKGLEIPMPTFRGKIMMATAGKILWNNYRMDGDGTMVI